MLGECWLSDVAKEVGTEALQHEARWGEILRVVCRLLSVNSESKQLCRVCHHSSNTCPGSHGCLSGSFLLSVLFLVTQPESCFTEAGRAPAN